LSTKKTVVFLNVSALWTTRDGCISQAFSSTQGQGMVMVRDGHIICAGQKRHCAYSMGAGTEVVDLKGGSVSPGIVAAGANIGLGEILMEPSTMDGTIFDPLGSVPTIIGGDEALIHAVHGLQFATRDAL
jgi:imidazolonepropionase-like amidohydrolase